MSRQDVRAFIACRLQERSLPFAHMQGPGRIVHEKRMLNKKFDVTNTNVAAKLIS